MRITTWDIEKGGREKVIDILSVLKNEDSDIFVLTGFRTNHNKENILSGLKKIGYKYLIYNKKVNKHKDTILIASKEKLEIKKYNSLNKSSFLTIKKDDLYIATMNFTDSISQKELTNILKVEVDTYENEKLLLVGNMQTAQNYATPNSHNIKCCKKYMDFTTIGVKNCINECGYSNNEYTWINKNGCEYNVDFILANNNVDLENSYCYYNADVKKKGISSHCLITLSL